MASKRKSMSDERVGQALIKKVIQDELQLQEVPLEDSCLAPLLDAEPMTEEEQSTVAKLKRMFDIIHNKVKDDKEFQDLLASIRGDITQNTFKALADSVFRDGVNLRRIFVFFILTAILVVQWVYQKVVNFLQLIRDALKWTMDYFRDNLLDWIQECGGWIQSFFSEQRSSMQRMYRY